MEQIIKDVFKNVRFSSLSNAKQFVFLANNFLSHYNNGEVCLYKTYIDVERELRIEEKEYKSSLEYNVKMRDEQLKLQVLDEQSILEQYAYREKRIKNDYNSKVRFLQSRVMFSTIEEEMNSRKDIVTKVINECILDSEAKKMVYLFYILYNSFTALGNNKSCILDLHSACYETSLSPDLRSLLKNKDKISSITFVPNYEVISADCNRRNKYIKKCSRELKAAGEYDYYEAYEANPDSTFEEIVIRGGAKKAYRLQDDEIIRISLALDCMKITRDVKDVELAKCLINGNRNNIQLTITRKDQIDSIIDRAWDDAADRRKLIQGATRSSVITKYYIPILFPFHQYLRTIKHKIKNGVEESDIIFELFAIDDSWRETLKSSNGRIQKGRSRDEQIVIDLVNSYIL